MRRELLLAGLALVVLAERVCANEEHDVHTLTEWVAVHPEQRELMRDFSVRVSGEAVRATFEEGLSAKIAVIYPALQESDYWRRNVMAFRARLGEIGLPYELETFFSRPGETHLQAVQLRQALDGDPDYLLVTLDALADLSFIERLLVRGRPRLIIQNFTTPIRYFGERQPLLYCGFDHELGSLLLADYFAGVYPGGARWSLLLFTAGYVSEQRGGAFERVLAAHPAMRLEEIYLTGGTRERARLSALDALERHPELDFFFACTTDVALGAADALRATGRAGSTAVNGWGGGRAELEALARGELLATVMRMNDDAGVAMAEAIALDLRGKGAEVPAVYSGSFELITREASPATIERFGARAFRYSGLEGGQP
jgi:autoinducer 2-binding periplasmic protein LuxP